MARARRAKTRPSVVVVPVVIALVVAGVVAAQQGWLSRDPATTAPEVPTVMASQRTAAPGTAGSSSSATPADPSSRSTDASSEPTADQTDSAGQQALRDCRTKVRAADKTLKAATVGIGHWSAHVQAQTDANAGKISVDTMGAIFKRTRVAGAHDLRKYRDALKNAADLTGSCDVPDGASAAVADQIKDCAARSQAQKPLVRAARDGMDDWESHLAAMRRSRMGHVHDAEGVWIRAWRAAPPHIVAFEDAKDHFDAPRC